MWPAGSQPVFNEVIGKFFFAGKSSGAGIQLGFGEVIGRFLQVSFQV